MSGALSPALGFAAGALTILSPCVLPLVPIVLGSALQKSRFGPLALSAGLVVSFTGVGLAVASAGTLAGLDADGLRVVGAVMLLLAGIVLAIPIAQGRLAALATPLAGWAARRQAGLAAYGLAGQAGIGVLLGLVWSPCVGPTLGAATVVASQGGSLGAAAVVMVAFALGMVVVLLGLSFATRTLLARRGSQIMAAASRGKMVLGGVMIAVGLMVLTGTDHLVEGLILSLSPDWLVDASTSI